MGKLRVCDRCEQQYENFPKAIDGYQDYCEDCLIIEADLQLIENEKYRRGEIK